jgi:deferrochelatase/peroxidase EfeB
MGPGPVTSAAAPLAQAAGADADTGSWTLQPEIAGDVQGLVVSAYVSLPAARALFLECKKSGGAWLAALRAVAPVTAADGPQQPATVIAFTATGLKQLGLSDPSLASFQLPFQEGMLQTDRRRRLGDTVADVLTAPIPAWSGNTPEQDPSAKSPATVHALLIFYDTSDAALDAHVARVSPVLAAGEVSVVRDMRLDMRLDDRGIPREHFGFSDGISQPVPFAHEVIGRAGTAYPRDPLHGVPLGDILLGYTNAHDEIPPGPVVTHHAELQGAPSGPHADKPELLAKIAGSPGLYDLGKNGTYLIVRELKQDVPAFWQSLDRAAATLNQRTGNTPGVDADWLAARVIGRDPDGNLLRPEGPVPPKNGQPDNDFLFFAADRQGFGCPLGSHVRRANPRDSLAYEADACTDLLTAANNHRILRRGRKFGPTIADPRVPDGVDRGLLFICMNTDIERQFEFVQQNWLLNPNFATLFKEVDPLVGPAGPMTLPAEPLRRDVQVETYVKLTGGEYFFLPSLSALAYFETLPPKS